MSGGGGREPFPGSDGRRGRRCVRGALRAVRSHVGTESVERECGGGSRIPPGCAGGLRALRFFLRAPLVARGALRAERGLGAPRAVRCCGCWEGSVRLCAALCGSGPTRALSLQKYYPPDFDPAKIPKLKLPKDRQYVVRLMAPFNMR